MSTMSEDTDPSENRAVARNAAVWARLDLRDATFSRLPDGLDEQQAHLHALITTVVLPRYGAVVRELTLRDTAVGDDTLRSVVTACPQLRLLDVRGCYNSLEWSCDEEDDDEGSQFLELMTIQYSRAAAGQQFTLLMNGSGFTGGCSMCMYLCNDNILDTLHAVQQWPIQPGPMTAADGNGCAATWHPVACISAQTILGCRVKGWSAFLFLLSWSASGPTPFALAGNALDTPARCVTTRLFCVNRHV